MASITITRDHTLTTTCAHRTAWRDVVAAIAGTLDKQQPAGNDLRRRQTGPRRGRGKQERLHVNGVSQIILL